MVDALILAQLFGVCLMAIAGALRPAGANGTRRLVIDWSTGEPKLSQSGTKIFRMRELTGLEL